MRDCLATSHFSPGLAPRTSYCTIATSHFSPGFAPRTSYCTIATSHFSPGLAPRTSYCTIATSHFSPGFAPRTSHCTKTSPGNLPVRHRMLSNQPFDCSPSLACISPRANLRWITPRPRVPMTSRAWMYLGGRVRKRMEESQWSERTRLGVESERERRGGGGVRVLVCVCVGGGGGTPRTRDRESRHESFPCR
jgi:hypothetical protein